jgi:hypothetical protein
MGWRNRVNARSSIISCPNSFSASRSAGIGVSPAFTSLAITRKSLVFLAAKCVQSHGMTFGFSSLIDLLTWAIVTPLGLTSRLQ